MNNQSTPSPVVWLKDDIAGQSLLQLAPEDNVGVALRLLKAGEDINGVKLEAPVHKGHKVALQPIDKGARIVKYAQCIGIADGHISPGEHVHSHNLLYQESDAQHQVGSEYSPVPVNATDSFLGFDRGNGKVGTRNYIAIISSVNCSATAVHHIAASVGNDILDQYQNVDGIAAFTHGTGCGMQSQGDGWENLQRVLAGYALHPNVGAVLFVGLGCEMSQLKTVLQHNALNAGPMLRTMNIQSIGGHRKTVEAGRAHLLEMLPDVNAFSRQAAPASALSLALQCGGSDAWSGITANPALGYASDLLVRQGGTTVLAETPEIYGAEHLLTNRSASDAVADELMQRIAWWQDYVAKNNGSMDNNPSPGNKLGGLTTILEKSLGAVAKGGTSPLAGVYRYAESIAAPGFAFMDSPGYDPASVTGQIATGCNLVAFTTGRGSTFGSKPAPCLKISTNTDMYDKLSDDMDINAGTIVSDGDSVADVGQRIYDRLLAVASGSPTLSEEHGLGDNEFVPWQIGATM